MTKQAADDEPGDVFPREVVEKLRRESASYRDRAKSAEDRLSAMQRQSVERQITDARIRLEAVWAVVKLDELIADDGTVDKVAVARAMATARQTLGIDRRGAPHAEASELHSGATAKKDHTPGPGFEAAFGRGNPQPATPPARAAYSAAAEGRRGRIEQTRRIY